jgi:hypothetical protein
MGETNRDLNECVYKILRDGTLIESCFYCNYTFQLYSVEACFMEVLYDRYERRIVWAMKASDRDLQKYLQRIEIDLAQLTA